MTNSITFTVEGVPVAKQRARTVTRNGHTRTFTPAKTRGYEALVAECAREAMGDHPPMKGRVEVVISAAFVPPVSWSQKKYDAAITGKHWPPKSDIDNIAKAILDGAQAGGAYLNDKQVCSLYAHKRYSARAGVTVTVKTMEEFAQQFNGETTIGC